MKGNALNYDGQFLTRLLFLAAIFCFLLGLTNERGWHYPDLAGAALLLAGILRRRGEPGGLLRRDRRPGSDAPAGPEADD